MLGKKQLLMIAGLILGYGWMLKGELMSIREVGIICVAALATGAYTEYRRRKLVKKFNQKIKDRLSKQARRFHGEFWRVIHMGPWGNDELKRLMDLQGEFQKRSPADRYDTTDLKNVLRK